MKKSSILLIGIFLISAQVDAQISHGGRPYSFDNADRISANIPEVVMPYVDVAQLLVEDSIEEAQGLPWRFGKDIDVNLNLTNSGLWETLENGDRLWRLQITSFGAVSINLIYNYFEIPDGSTFFLYNNQKETLLGSFTKENNNYENYVFSTMPTKGETTILEYYEPKPVTGLGIISISYVIHGYKDIFDFFNKGFGDSRLCEVNVGALAGDRKRGVAMILAANNNRLCSGSLINNLNNDGKPLLLTANHCNHLNNPNGPNTWIFMFGYEAAAATNNTVNNSVIKANGAGSDFLLLELSTKPPLSYNIYYNGWNAAAAPPNSAYCVHHPAGDVQKYSQENH
ncbi:MAG: hypothetical protein JW861_07030, partial [Bacteroidales bacterium]|nr:hypothetical protein [Bacteroidales bacterium]